MPPLRGKPRVVEVQPANHRADVESRLHRIKLKTRARHRAPSEPRFPAQSAPAASCTPDTPALPARSPAYRSGSSAPCSYASSLSDLITQRIIGDVGENLVRRRPLIARCATTLNLPLHFYLNCGCPRSRFWDLDLQLGTFGCPSHSRLYRVMGGKALSPLTNRYKFKFSGPVYSWPRAG